MVMDDLPELIMMFVVLAAIALSAAVVGGWMVRAFYWAMGA